MVHPLINIKVRSYTLRISEEVQCHQLFLKKRYHIYALVVLQPSLNAKSSILGGLQIKKSYSLLNRCLSL